MTFPLTIVNFNHFFIQPAPDPFGTEKGDLFIQYCIHLTHDNKLKLDYFFIHIIQYIMNIESFSIDLMHNDVTSIVAILNCLIFPDDDY